MAWGEAGRPSRKKRQLGGLAGKGRGSLGAVGLSTRGRGAEARLRGPCFRLLGPHSAASVRRQGYPDGGGACSLAACCLAEEVQCAHVHTFSDHPVAGPMQPSGSQSRPGGKGNVLLSKLSVEPSLLSPMAWMVEPPPPGCHAMSRRTPGHTCVALSLLLALWVWLSPQVQILSHSAPHITLT